MSAARRLTFSIVVTYAVACLTACGIVESRNEGPLRPLAPVRSFAPEQRILFDTLLSDRSGEHRMLCVLELGSGGLAFASFTQIGQPLFSIAYGEDGMIFDRGALRDGAVDARQVLADLQLAYWPDASQQAALDGTRWRLETTDGSRRLYYDGVLRVELRTDGGSQVISNQIAGYELSLREL